MMRVSSVRGSPHYVRWALVKLYGAPQPLALEADDVEGWVDVVDLAAPEPHEKGGPAARPGALRYPVKRLYGHVEIELAP